MEKRCEWKGVMEKRRPGGWPHSHQSRHPGNSILSTMKKAGHMGHGVSRGRRGRHGRHGRRDRSRGGPGERRDWKKKDTFYYLFESLQGAAVLTTSASLRCIFNTNILYCS